MATLVSDHHIQKRQSVSVMCSTLMHHCKPRPRPEPGRSPLPREPRFLSKGVVPILGTLAKDFVNFSLILVFYACCWSVGSAAFMLDNTFNTRLFERFTRFIEYLDIGAT